MAKCATPAVCSRSFYDHLPHMATAPDATFLIWQVRHIRRLFVETFGAETAAEVEVNSVDGFQGTCLIRKARHLPHMVT